MACGSLSIVSCSSVPEPSSSIQSLHLRSNTSFKPFLSVLRPPLRFRRPRALILKQSVGVDDEGTAEQFRENNAISDFMRFRSGGGGGSGELQTAVVTYKKRFPWSILKPFLQVDLVSTIHIADKQYFETLQKGLESYDCVLYEMVASRESLENRKNSTSAKRLKASRSRGFNILGFIQRQMARVLALDFQLDCLDYQGEKWLHADLDFETFKSLQVERGESFFTFARDMTLSCLTSEFTQITATVEEKSVIIGERNRVATEALQRAIDDGHNRIAVLYGGGHMPDLGRRLREEFDMVPSQVQWITAWSIRNRELNARSIPFLNKLAELSGWPLNRYQTLALLIFSTVLAVDLWFWEVFFGTMVHLASLAASEVNLLTQSM
ncbi:hypothetical protein J5N97_028031 [Dioscorea zingiberensis]|uniref:Uncharacterized protein n=1 Tax=Dioscorea zingiberensis TaxID=325984 RepID=A0A9D5BYA9_9LILI|nr:hypothetical protein J5N97_028031 [Dioscorea zingiberensis]